MFGIGGTSFIDFKAADSDGENLYSENNENNQFKSSTGIVGLSLVYFFNEKTSGRLVLAATTSGTEGFIDTIDVANNATRYFGIIQRQNEYKALRNQVNPHFLFNSLNTLASIIPDQPDNAVQFTLKLSQVYRSILDLIDKQAVTVQEELAFLENYIYLCKTRFDKGISFDIAISDEARKQFLVPLTLQMLLENAIKHNIVSQRKPLHIEIYNEGDEFICMRNNVQEKSSEVEGTGTGIRNIRERYQLTFGLPVIIEHGAESFVAKLPIIPIHDYTSAHR